MKRSYWATDSIKKVVNAGYMVGYADGSFYPDAPITRAELVRLVLEMRGVHPIPLDGFADTSGHHLQDDIGTAKWLGFVAGEGNGHFDPNGGTERQAAAKLFDVGLFRGPLVNGGTQVAQHFPDVTRGTWSFGWVEESAVVAHESLHKGRGVEVLVRYLPDQTKQM